MESHLRTNCVKTIYSPDAKQPISHQVMVLCGDGTSVAESVKAIQHPCNAVGPLEPQQARRHASPVYLRVEPERAVLIFVIRPPCGEFLPSVTLGN